MLNYIWASMIVLGILFGAVNGNMEEITEAALDSAGEAVSLCIAMAGIMAFWVGLMEVAQSSGLITRLTDMLSPFISFMFPGLPKGHRAKGYISMNIIANVLGLGWAATPAGLKAMEELSKDPIPQNGKVIPGHISTNEMCTFLVINISSLQLIPVNMIAYRSQYHSQSPASIVAPAILATTISTLAGVIFCKIMCRRKVKVRE